MTPIQIEFLLHCYYSSEIYRNLDDPAIIEAIADGLKDGLIEPHKSLTDVYTATRKGSAHVIQICRLPLPIERWVDFTGTPITTT